VGLFKLKPVGLVTVQNQSLISQIKIMLKFFKEIIHESVVTHLKSENYTQEKYQASNILEENDVYFSKIVGDLNFNIHIGLGSGDDQNSPERLEYRVHYGVYSKQFSEVRNYPISDQPSGSANTFYYSLDDLLGIGQYWQAITSATEKKAATDHLLDILRQIMDFFAPIRTWEDLLAVGLKMGPWYHSRFEHFVPYFKIMDDTANLEAMVAAIRQQLTGNSEGALEYFEQELVRLSDARVLKQKVANNFPKAIKLPKSWEAVLDWVEKNPHTVIGGQFGINENSNNMVQHIASPNSLAAKNIAVIGETSEQNLFCIWKADKKNMPIVLIEEGPVYRVMAANIDDFIQLLAIGYYNVEWADFDNPPVFNAENEHWKNAKFQAFYTKKFKKNIPATGREIVDRKGFSDADFSEWMTENS
jgi:hypothetical protein